MYLLEYKGKEYTIPKDKIYLFALFLAINNGIIHGPINDDKSAIEYLEKIGFKVI